MRFNEVAYLTAPVYTSDAIGNQIAQKTERKVYVNCYRLSESGIQAAALTGLTPECELQLRAVEYQGEQLIRFRDIEMSVISLTGSGEFMRIIAGRKASND